MMLLSQQFQWPYFPVPNFKAINRTRKLASVRMNAAGVVGKAVGSAMAIMLAEMDDIEGLVAVRTLGDPAEFVFTCGKLLDDGAKKTFGGGPKLDDLNEEQVQARDVVWASARHAVQAQGSESLNLSGSRSRYSPI